MKTKQIVWGVAGAILIGVAAFVMFALPGYREQARIGAAFGARVACSCRYIGGRTLSDCRKDFEPGMEPITLSEDPATKSVTARYPVLASATARYEEGWGCRLELKR